MEFLHSLNLDYLSQLEATLARDPEAVPPEWRALIAEEGARNGAQATAEQEGAAKQVRIGQVVNAFRVHGHRRAHLDPLGLAARPTLSVLAPETWGFTQEDLDQTFSTASLFGPQSMTLRALLSFLDETYCRTIGCEVMHLSDLEARDWLLERCESTRNHCDLDTDTQRFILEELCAAEAFETFLHTKFIGAKRFSLEGGEALLPMLSLLMDEAAQHGARAFVLGMAHRGRLNVLVNLGCKARQQVFREFADLQPQAFLGRGDVKYHLGCRHQLATRSGHLVDFTLTFNPSHLEFINPVVEGIARARQDLSPGGAHRVVPVLIHGDAAFIGQGVVAETLNLMHLEGYRTGGTLHIVINNQLGFTTDPRDSRSSAYCTDIAKMNEVPVFHVNGEDPEAVVHVSRIAAAFRQRFARDVIIDLVCFRRYGHNESDEPRFTQPLLYRAIEAHPKVHMVYRDHLARQGRVAVDPAEILARQQAMLEAELQAALAETRPGPQAPLPCGSDADHLWDACVPEVATAVAAPEISALLTHLATVPAGFKAHRVVQRVADQRQRARDEGLPLDWATAELLAYGSLLRAGYAVRLSGQDVQRGTFSHRHAVWIDQESEGRHIPLAQLGAGQGPFRVFNSPLSEAGVLGFEFGYAAEGSQTLVVWEAQFGDFANGAQVITDQFISASEDKWGILSPVVLLLPHGYEGQGPDHSSARLERFLQLCAEDNIQVCNLTTPAQFFHALRRQVLRPFPKPLVVMSPKSLLRHKEAVSPWEAFTEAGFARVLGDEHVEADAVRRVVLCSGHVYYDLLEARRDHRRHDVALVRLEQLYPFPAEALRAAVARFPRREQVVWCQEEPQNMGAYSFLLSRLPAISPEIQWVSREASASTATGSPKAHRIEQEALVREALAL